MTRPNNEKGRQSYRIILLPLYKPNFTSTWNILLFYSLSNFSFARTSSLLSPSPPLPLRAVVPFPNKSLHDNVPRLVERMFKHLIYHLVHVLFACYLFYIKAKEYLIANIEWLVYVYKSNHNHDLAYIQENMKRFMKLPLHLAISLQSEENDAGEASNRTRTSTTDTSILWRELGQVISWCIASGIYQISVYDRQGKTT